VIFNGCQFDYLNTMNEYELKTYYKNLNIEYDNITLLTKQMFCLNKTIDYIFISNDEFFIFTKSRKIRISILTILEISLSDEWLYGKERFSPSIINLQQCNSIELMDFNISQCLVNFSCSSYCSYIRFEPLFDINQIYILEKNSRKCLKFILESYTIIPIMISSEKTSFLNYSINYTINRLDNGIIQMLGVSLRGLRRYVFTL
jgi:hypothetical protein